MYFVTGLNLVLQQPSIAVLAKTKTDFIFPHIVSAETIFFLNLEIQRSPYIRPKVTLNKCAETIQGRKLFKGENYMRNYGIAKKSSYCYSTC